MKKAQLDDHKIGRRMAFTQWMIKHRRYSQIRKEAMPNSIGRMMDITKAARLFIGLRDVLSDYDIAVKVFNTDEEVGNSIRQKSFINELKKDGLI